MKEDEAKTKWCPYSRYVIDSANYASGNRFDGGDESSTGSMAQKGCLCLGSRCMAWRSKETSDFARSAEVEFHRSGRRLAPGPDQVDGYCGLAGKP